jgi:hypothetical protein
MIDSLQIWKSFHWSFVIDIQGLIICLRRFEIYIALDDLLQAQVELATATEMMLASSAAMELAGSFNRQEYQNVRQTMTFPNVRSKNFSGIMCWEHASLIQVWKRLCPTFATLPVELQPQHNQFIAAYFELMNAHRSVCEKFVGEQGGSLRFARNKAVDTLDKFAHSRLQLIDPNDRSMSSCPFSAHKS